MKMAYKEVVELLGIKADKKAGSPKPESETVTPEASFIVVSPFLGIRELSTLDGLGDPCLSFNNLDIGNRFHNYLNNYRLKILSTYVSTCKSRQSQNRKEEKKIYKVEKVRES